MGNHRSRSGCLTCRTRRVKCDETHPVCRMCSKKNRPCQWEAPHTRFKDFQPEASTAQSAASAEGDGDEFEDSKRDGNKIGRRGNERYYRSNSPRVQGNPTQTGSVSSTSAQLSPGSPFLSTSPGSGLSVGGLISTFAPASLPDIPKVTLPLQRSTIPLTHAEAVLVHHYTERLGRWLDCTDATRQFTLRVPEMVKSCPVLCHAVLSFAARHRREDTRADDAYQRCIALLIERLSEDSASHDQTLLCAIVILRFYEQLNVPSATGSDDEQHLAGCSAIIRTSQGHHYVDPSAPSLREAAFWVYVRQCLYNATIHQVSPNIDFSLQLDPVPEVMEDTHPLARLRVETAWANQMTWYTARVVNFCFERPLIPVQMPYKMQQWHELQNLVQTWNDNRPAGFDPIFESPAHVKGVFPQIIFTADWHIISFAFYHFACILLLNFDPDPKFTIPSPGHMSEVNHQVLRHARAICGASKSSPETVPLSITVCHTIFIWGPLVTDLGERSEIIQLLLDFERDHLWPTTWIINTLKREWGLDA